MCNFAIHANFPVSCTDYENSFRAAHYYLFHFYLVNITVQGQLFWQLCIPICPYFQPLWQGHQTVYSKTSKWGSQKWATGKPFFTHVALVFLYCLTIFKSTFCIFHKILTFLHASAPFLFFQLPILHQISNNPFWLAKCPQIP